MRSSCLLLEVSTVPIPNQCAHNAVVALTHTRPQERLLERSSGDWKRAFYMPATADTGVITWRQWFDQVRPWTAYCTLLALCVILSTTFVQHFRALCSDGFADRPLAAPHMHYTYCT